MIILQNNGVADPGALPIRTAQRLLEAIDRATRREIRQRIFEIHGAADDLQKYLRSIRD